MLYVSNVFRKYCFFYEIIKIFNTEKTITYIFIANAAALKKKNL